MKEFIKKNIGYIICAVIITIMFIYIVIPKDKVDTALFEQKIEIQQDSIKYLDKLCKQEKIYSDSLKLEMGKKDTLIAEVKKNIILIEKKYEKKSNTVSKFTTDQSVKFLTDWLSLQDNNK